MKFLPSALFSLVLFIVSAVLMYMHWRAWKVFQQGELPPAEFDYRRRQFRRRMQASGMIGIIGVALFAGVAFFLGRESLVPWIEDVVVIVTYWFAVVVVTAWMFLLAFVDMWATRRYLTRICEDDLLEQTRFHADLFRQKRVNRENQNAGGGEHLTEGEESDARD
jgi:hypothetical protein